MDIPYSLYSDLLAVPYVKDGRNMSGLDCVGVFLEMQRRLGRDVSFYSSDQSGLDKALGEWDKVDSPLSGDGILIYSCDPAWHVGVVISRNTFIHGKEGAGVVVESFGRPEFSRRIEGFYRWKTKASAL